MSVKLKLSLTTDEGEECLFIEGLDPDRFAHHGFGTFMLEVKPEEVAISDEARAGLLSQPERGGVQGMEFWPENRLSWGSSGLEFTVPLDCINVPTGAKVWIRELKGEE